MDLLKEVTSEIVGSFPDKPRHELRETIANNLAAILVEQQLQLFREGAIKAVREAILPTVDQAIAEALEAVDHEENAAWDKWQKILGDTTRDNLSQGQ